MTTRTAVLLILAGLLLIALAVLIDGWLAGHVIRPDWAD